MDGTGSLASEESQSMQNETTNHNLDGDKDLSRKRPHDDFYGDNICQDLASWNEGALGPSPAKRSKSDNDNHKTSISGDADFSGDTQEYPDWLEDDFFDRVVKKECSGKAALNSEENGHCNNEAKGHRATYSSNHVQLDTSENDQFRSNDSYIPNCIKQLNSNGSPLELETPAENDISVDEKLGESSTHPRTPSPFLQQGKSGQNMLSSVQKCEKPEIVKSESVTQDAEKIASLLNSSDVSIIFEKLSNRRTAPNRVEVVMNEMLEETIDLTKETSDDEDAKTMNDLLADVDNVISKVKESKFQGKVDPNEIYMMLESHVNKPNRVTVVSAIITSRTIAGQSRPSSIVDLTEKDRPGIFREESSQSGDIMDEVTLVSRRFPKVDANMIFEMLDERKECNRVQIVMDCLASKEAKCGLDCTDSNRTIQLAQGQELDMSNDPLYREMVEISNMFPDRDKNEIYAYLQHYHNRPDRVALVTDELLGAGGQSQSSQQGENMSNSHTASATVSTPALTSVDSETRQVSEVLGEDVGPLAQLEKEVETMKALFPDCDPYYLYESLERRINDPERVQKLSEEMFNLRSYPKLKDRIEKEKIQALKRRLEKLEFNMEEFLAMFPECCTSFYDETTAVNNNYRLHALAQLKNVFPLLHATFIEKKLDEHKGHFTPTVRELEDIWLSFVRTNQHNRRKRHKKSSQFRKQPRQTQEAFPDTPDEYFYKEVLFTQHEQEIKNYIKQKADEKQQRLEQARANGDLHECGCCYDDEVLFEDMLACPEGHMFCRECVRKSSEEIIGQSKVKFPCLGGDCESEFTTAILQKVLSSKMLSNLLRKIQEEEVRQAGITDLESCPFCSFATIMTDVEDKVFKCQNPECLKESCRICKETNHIPLRCEEVEKQGETNMRTYIENKMAEAMIRVCWKCNKRFFKEEGCNKMTCSCGASMCYVCRKPIKGYDHFGPGGCPQATDVYALHQEEIKKAGLSAKKEFTTNNPETSNTELKHDPLKNLPKEGKADHQHTGFGFGVPFLGAPFGGPFPFGVFHPFPHIQLPFGGIHYGVYPGAEEYEDDDDEHDEDDQDDDDDPDDYISDRHLREELALVSDDEDEGEDYW